MIQRRSSRKVLADTPINEAIVERYYQTRAIRRIAEAVEQHHQRKALVVMATANHFLLDVVAGMATVVAAAGFANLLGANETVRRWRRQLASRLRNRFRSAARAR